MEKRFVRRNEKVNYMLVGEGNYNRMKFFTAMSEEKNPLEYSRQYVDEAYERVDIVGISSGVSFSMDQRTNDEVHEIITDIFDNERLGDDATVSILSVDFSKEPTEVEEGKVGYPAKLRDFSVIPESEGGEAEVYSYEGSLRAKGVTVKGIAVFDGGPIDSLEECTFQEEE